MGVKDYKSGDLRKMAQKPFPHTKRDSLGELGQSLGDENFYDLSEMGNIGRKKPRGNTR